MVYDSGRGVVVLFGGVRANDTWEWDGNAWREVETPTAPAPRSSLAMAYDSSRGVTVLFGGRYEDTMYADTWEYDGRDWVEVTPDASPPAMGALGMAYDAGREVVVLIGIEGQLGLWEYDGQTWVQVSVSGPRGLPVLPDGRGLLYDSARGVVVLAGGLNLSEEPLGIWEYDGHGWIETVGAEQPRPQVSEPASAYDSERGRVVLFGGLEAGSLGLGLSSTTWEYDGALWGAVRVERPPRARRSAGLVYDSARNVTVLFGGVGQDGDEPLLLNDTWEYRPE